ncbi:MAG TPA: hypothetical protein K8V35_01810 [Aliicoccus persicus]|uniref:DUF3923 family protein n=1 Tax=Aliicoccus persicus TaxID=930138 RepID=A0A921B5A3_9STAP|nr:hypothetical protein [Aliicoccus persicus]
MNFKMILWWIVNVFWLFIFVGFATSITMNWLGDDGYIVETGLQALVYYIILIVLISIPAAAQIFIYRQLKKGKL